MARVRGHTALLRRYSPFPAFAQGRTGEGTIYPFGPWNMSDAEWDLYSAFCFRVTAWRYNFSNSITAAYTEAGVTTSYGYTANGSIDEGALPFANHVSDQYQGIIAGAAAASRPILTTPAAAALSEKIFAHPYSLLARGSGGTSFATTGSYDVNGVGGSLNGEGASGASASPAFDDPSIDEDTDKLLRGSCFKSGNARYLALSFSGSFADNRTIAAMGFNPGEFTFTNPDATTQPIRFNILVASLINFQGYHQVGTLTINWPYWKTQSAGSVNCPLYAPNPLGSQSMTTGYSGISVAQSFNVTMDPISFLPYGRDPVDKNAYSEEAPIWDKVSGARLKWPIGPR